MRTVNGKSMVNHLRKLTEIIRHTEGHVLILGGTGTGKSTLLNGWVLNNSAKATYRDFMNRRLEPTDLNEDILFRLKTFAVLDGVYFDSDNTPVFNAMLRTCRKRHHRLIIASMEMPDKNIIPLFQSVIQFKTLPPGNGVELIINGAA